MQDLDKALADIVAIRSQIARDTAFRGLGAATVAGTGFLALACAAGQALWLGDPRRGRACSSASGSRPPSRLS